MHHFISLSLQALFLLALSFSPPALAAQMVWRISSGEENYHYLVGSVHRLPDEAYPLDSAFDIAYQEADTLVFETEMNRLGLLWEIASKNARYPDGKGLRDTISPDFFALLEGMLPLWQLSIKELEPYRPWHAADIICNARSRQRGHFARRGLEAHFLDMARSDGKPTLGLAPAEEHLKFFFDVPDELGINRLKLILAETELDALPPQSPYLMWKSGDIEGLEAYAQDFRKKRPAEYDWLVRDRNLAWADTIQQLLSESGRYTIVVGAMHLVGEHSLPRLLRENGYVVEQFQPQLHSNHALSVEDGVVHSQ